MVSVFYNHHLDSLSKSLYDNSVNSFCFISTETMPEERRNLGWELDALPPYVTSDISKAFSAEAIILGMTSSEQARRIINSEKIIFRYSERPLKHGSEPLKYLPRFLRWHKRNPHGKPIYLLCASAYTSYDYAKFGLFRHKAYKWGYFPETRRYPDIDALMQRKNPKRILWCGRFLDWKHPDDAIRVAKLLKDDGEDFQLDFIGTGEMEDGMRSMIAELGLEAQVHILGAMPPAQVRNEMELSGIYLFTSDRQEGWGAVLNEAMNSGCAVVASHIIGSVPYLISDNENGLVYRSGNVQALYKKVKRLLADPAEQRRLGSAAYKTIAEEWNAEVAAERFIKLVEAIENGNRSPELFASGPCSRAELIRESWFND